MTIVPAVLSASRAELERELRMLAKIPAVSQVQMDIVDGRFAEPASWPYTAPGELARMVQQGETLPHLERLTYEIDLMCLDAFDTVEAWIALGASRLTFHAECATDVPRRLASIRKRYGGGLVPGLISFGLALNIASDLALLEMCLDDIDYVQCMGIARIGKQGQPFDRRVYEKIRVFHERHPRIPIQVDGGVSLVNAKKLSALGASRLVVGSAIIGTKDPAAVIEKFIELMLPQRA